MTHSGFGRSAHPSRSFIMPVIGAIHPIGSFARPVSFTVVSGCVARIKEGRDTQRTLLPGAAKRLRENTSRRAEGRALDRVSRNQKLAALEGDRSQSYANWLRFSFTYSRCPHCENIQFRALAKPKKAVSAKDSIRQARRLEYVPITLIGYSVQWRDHP